MSMSTHVVGIKPPDEKWKAMKRIWDACQAAGIDPPAEVDKFFNGEDPDQSGVVVDLDKHPCAKEYNAEMQNGIEIDLRKVPGDVAVIRFVNSY